MSINEDSLLHLCEVAKRNLAFHTRDIIPFFLIHKTGARAAALDRQKDGILNTKAGEHLLQLLETQKDRDHSACPGVIYFQSPGIFGFTGKPHIIAPVILNMDEFEDTAHAHHAIYHLLWHALHIMDLFVSHKQDDEAQTCVFQNHTITLKADRLHSANNNLMADVFAAIMTEIEKEKDFIQKLGQKRARAALQKAPGTLCETYPFPIVTDACRMVYDDLKYGLKDKKQRIPFALKMAREVAETYGNQAYYQWRDFCVPAQKMLWLGHDIATIMGCAVFTSENAYVRATGYLVCEYLNFHPAPAANAELYNPFAPETRIGELHRKSCENAFQEAFYKAAMEGTSGPFLEMAKSQNKTLAHGNAFGWCAHALNETALAFDQNHDSEFDVESLQHTFITHVDRIAWPTLARIGENILDLLRNNQEFSLKQAMKDTKTLQGSNEIMRTMQGSAKLDFIHAQKLSAQKIGLKENVQIGFLPHDGNTYEDTIYLNEQTEKAAE